MTDTTSNTKVRRRRMARDLEPAAAPPTRNSPGEAIDKPQTKSSLVLDMLRRPDGASLDELVAMTGWLPHTTRAALTGFRKKGHAIDKRKADGVTRYMVAPVAAR